MSTSFSILITFAAYLAAMLAIGVWAYRQTNDLSDYILGGRSLGLGHQHCRRVHQTCQVGYC